MLYQQYADSFAKQHAANIEANLFSWTYETAKAVFNPGNTLFTAAIQAQRFTESSALSAAEGVVRRVVSRHLDSPVLNILIPQLIRFEPVLHVYNRSFCSCFTEESAGRPDGDPNLRAAQECARRVQQDTAVQVEIRRLTTVYDAAALAELVAAAQVYSFARCAPLQTTVLAAAQDAFAVATQIAETCALEELNRRLEACLRQNDPKQVRPYFSNAEEARQAGQVLTQASKLFGADVQLLIEGADWRNNVVQPLRVTLLRKSAVSARVLGGLGGDVEWNAGQLLISRLRWLSREEIPNRESIEAMWGDAPTPPPIEEHPPAR